MTVGHPDLREKVAILLRSDRASGGTIAAGRLTLGQGQRAAPMTVEHWEMGSAAFPAERALAGSRKSYVTVMDTAGRKGANPDPERA